MTRNRLAFGVMILATVACLAWQAWAGDPAKKGETGVRHLRIDRKDLPFPPIGGGSETKILKSQEEVEKVAGAKAATALAKLVDFAKESVVFVSWQTGGPPFGELKYEIKGKDKDRQLVFYVQEPPGKGPRGQALRIGGDFFAVPRDLAVEVKVGRR
jgi:hypothetical protein